MNRKTIFFILIGTLFLVAVLAVWQGVAQAAKGPFSVKLQGKIDTSAQKIINLVSMAVDGDGNVYIADYGDAPGAPRVLKYDKQGRFVLAWGNEGSGDGQFIFYPPEDPNMPAGGFVAIDSQNNLWVSDAYNCRVQKFDPNGNFLMKFGECGEDNGQFEGLSGPIYIDSQDNIYVSSFPRVQKFDAQGNFLASYGSAGTAEGQFSGAALGAVDKQGNLYIGDLMNARMQKLDMNGNFVLAWGSTGTGDGQFNTPVGVVLDKAERLYVTDNTNRVQVFDIDGKFIAQWSETGQGNPPLEGMISALAIDRKGDIYVGDMGPAHNIYIFRPKP